MPPKKRAKVPVVSSDLSDDDLPLLSQPKKTARKTYKSAQRAKNSDEFRDKERKDERKLQQLGNIESYLKQERVKYKESVRKYRKKALQKKEDVLSSAKQYEQELEKAQTQFKERLATACADLAPGIGGNGAASPPSRECHPLFEANQQIFKAYRAILECYCKADVRTQEVAAKLEVPRKDWDGDERDMKQVLGYGRQYGEALAEAIIMPTQETPAPVTDPGGRAGLSEPEELAVNMFETSHGSLRIGTWGQAAYSHVKALTNLVNIVPVAVQGE